MQLNENNSILVVEDEKEIRDLMTLLLQREGYKVFSVSNAVEGELFLDRNPISVVVLDWMLPQVSGMDWLKNIRNGKNADVAVLMVTAKTQDEDILQGLDAGADDYLPKPFDPKIFLARVKALLRRVQWKNQSKQSRDVLKLANIQINLSSYEVKVDDQVVFLTPSEYKILTNLLHQTGKVMSRDQLIEIVQGTGVNVTGRTIDTHVFGLRKKLGPAGELIETIRGVGYRVKFEI